MATLAIPPTVRPRGTPMPLEEYLRTTFKPDRDYVDGHTEQRPVPEWDHANAQSWLITFFRTHSQDWGIKSAVELRLQVQPNRFRIPDIMVLRADQKVDRFPTDPPLICIEVLSPEDTLRRLQSVVDDYDAMGVQNIWAIDPELRIAYRCSRAGILRTEELTVDGTAIRVPLAELFASLG